MVMYRATTLFGGEFAPVDDGEGKEFVDIIYEKAVGEGIAKAGERNAFWPLTVKELMRAFNDGRDDSSIGVIIVSGQGTKAFCGGGDQALRTQDVYADPEDVGRHNGLDLQVAGYAVGGEHVLHMVCNLTIAADNAIFGQTGPKVGSFDAGYGSSIMSRLILHTEIFGTLDQGVEIWRALSAHKVNESVVNVLKTNLQQAISQGNNNNATAADQAKEGFGDSEIDDAASYIDPNNYLGIPGSLSQQGLKENPNYPQQQMLRCRACKVKEVSVLLVPCRHLSLCKDCDVFIGVCPVCQSMKTSSVQVFFS